MARRNLRELATLISRLAVIAGIAIAGILIYRWWNRPSAGDDFVIEDTPLHVEEIRRIIELNTIKFRDEVVVDSVEYYISTSEQIAGNVKKLFDPDQIRHGVSHSNVKRRLTMIIKGELLYGFDLKRKEFLVTVNDSQLVVKVPQPELLSISLTPKNTKIFVENGDWHDFERQLLQRKARNKMIASGEKLNLEEKAKAPLERLLKQLVQTKKQLVVEYY